MPSVTPPRETWIAAAIVVAASAALGGGLAPAGVLLLAGHAPEHLRFARLLGVGVGLLAGAGWIAWMRWTRLARSIWALAWSLLGGVAAGGLAALVVGGGLLLRFWRPDEFERVLVGGASVGLVAGGALGLAGGTAWVLALIGAEQWSPEARGVGREVGPLPPLPRLAAALVSLAGGGAGAFLGMLAGAGYEHQGSAAIIGLLLGAALGLAAGLAWVVWMRGRRSWRSRSVFVRRGLLGGVLAGAVAAMVLQLALLVMFGGWWNVVGQMLASLLFAFLPAALLGTVGGVTWAAASPPAHGVDGPST